jgi:DNA-3-methyladenine glycosylase II
MAPEQSGGPSAGSGPPALKPRTATPLADVQSHLRTSDPVMAELIDTNPTFDPRGWVDELPAMDLFGVLLFQVAGQQLSVVATRRTLARVQELFSGHLPSPTELLSVSPESLRQAGFSWRKVATLRDVAERLSDGRLDASTLSDMSDEDIIAALVEVPGIGPWTAQGALVLAFGREDVVLTGDLALRNAIRRRYQLNHLPNEAEVLAIAENWRPYRSVATAYLFSEATLSGTSADVDGPASQQSARKAKGE